MRLSLEDILALHNFGYSLFPYVFGIWIIVVIWQSYFKK